MVLGIPTDKSTRKTHRCCSSCVRLYVRDGSRGGHCVRANAVGALLENIIYFAAMYKIRLLARLRGCGAERWSYFGTSVRALGFSTRTDVIAARAVDVRRG